MLCACTCMCCSTLHNPHPSHKHSLLRLGRRAAWGVPVTKEERPISSQLDLFVSTTVSPMVSFSFVVVDPRTPPNNLSPLARVFVVGSLFFFYDERPVMGNVTRKFDSTLCWKLEWRSRCLRAASMMGKDSTDRARPSSLFFWHLRHITVAPLLLAVKLYLDVKSWLHRSHPKD